MRRMAKMDVPRNSTSQKRRHLIANIKDKEDAVVFAEVFGELCDAWVRE